MRNVAGAGVAACMLLGIPAHALPPEALPTGGIVSAGAGTIDPIVGSAMTVRQTSQRMAVDWSSFSIGANASVNFIQPNSAAVALNRVLGSSASEIYGKLSSNGQVFLINPNGILFGKGAEVNVGGLVASTLNLSNDDFMAGRTRFTGVAGSVANEGSIAGQYVALLGGQVSNRGTISARLGTAVLAAGSDVTLDFAGDGLIAVSVAKGALGALAENKQLINADGGTVILTAKAADQLIRAVVNNSGVIEARRVENHAGVIKLLGDMENGVAEVGGRLDASAANGDGGFIETSAAKVKIADDVAITTKATRGKNGTWLIDPNDFTIAASGGDISVATLQTALASNDVTIQTTSGNASCAGTVCGSGTSGHGDIFVNDAVSWSSHVLTLNAWRNIVLNATLNGSGTAGLAMYYGQAAANAGNTATYSFNNGAKINLASTGSFSTKLGNNVAATNYTVVTSLGAAGSVTGTDLQGMQNNLAGNYVLGADIDASPTATWNLNGAIYNGFAPIGGTFTGVFDGLGHTVTGLNINRTGTYVGMFGTNMGTIRNVGLQNSVVTGSNNVGALAGYSGGIVTNSRSSNGTISSTGTTGGVGGLVGGNGGTISNSYADGVVSNATMNSIAGLGGLVGDYSSGTVSNSYYDVDASSINGAHRLTGYGLYHAQYLAWQDNARAPLNIADYLSQDGAGYYQIGSAQNLKDMLAFAGTGASKFRLTADLDLASLPGWHIPKLTGQFDGNHHVLDYLNVGSHRNAVGFVGVLGAGGLIANLGLTNASISGQRYVAGLVGLNNGGTLDNSYVSGTISGYTYVGGLAGANQGYGHISDSYFSGSVSGTSSYIGGLVGRNGAFSPLDNSYAAVTMPGGGNYKGAVVGQNQDYAQVNACFWDATLYATGIGQVQGPNSTNDATGLTAGQMKSYAVFSAKSWDIAGTGGTSAVWRIYDGQSTPLLRSFLTPITVSPTSGTRTYDGTADTLGVSYSVVPNATLLGSPTITGAGRNATTHSLAVSGLYSSSQQGYDVSYAGGTMTITPATLTLNAVSTTKTYDGTPTSAGVVTSSGLQAGDSLAGLVQSYASKNALGAGNSMLNVTGYTVNDGNGGANYTVATHSATGTITPAALDLNAVSATKTYDGTTTSAGVVTSSGLKAGDSLTGLVQSYASKNALGAGNSTLNVTGYTVNDGNGGANYTVAVHPAAGTVLPLPVTLAGSRSYDGTTGIAAAHLAATNLVAGDSASLIGNGTLAAKDVGVQPIANLGSLAVGNSNYTMTGASGSVTVTPQATVPDNPGVGVIIRPSAAVTTSFAVVARNLDPMMADIYRHMSNQTGWAVDRAGAAWADRDSLSQANLSACLRLASTCSLDR
jgi:filamentous hemagglutinin family protein